MNLIASENLPFDLVTKDSFKEFVSVLNSGAKQPSKQSLMTLLLTNEIKIRRKLRQVLAVQKYVCTTVDVWSSRGRSYLGMTVHYIDCDTFERKSYVLAFRLLQKGQDHAYLGKIIHAVHKAYGLNTEKITDTITDGGSNLCKSFRVFGTKPSVEILPTIHEQCEAIESEEEMASSQSVDEENIDNIVEQFVDEYEEQEHDFIANKVDFTSLTFNEEVSANVSFEIDDESNEPTLPSQSRCFAHLFNLLSSSDFENRMKETCFGSQYRNMMNKLKRFWYVSRKSPNAKQIIKTVCGACFNVPNETRWNSLYNACNDVMKRKDVFVEAVNQMIAAKIKVEKLTKTEFLMLTDYVNCMTPIASALDILQGEKTVSAGYVLPTLQVVQSALLLTVTVSPAGKIIADTLLMAFKSRFSRSMRFNEDNKKLIVAAVSHPKFKLDWVPLEHKDFARNLFLEEYKMHDSTLISTDQSNIKNDFFKELLSTHSNIDASTVALQYLGDKNSDLSSLKQYPVAAEIYLKFNTSLPSSAPVERLFSHALIIFSPRRSSISAKNFERVLCYKKNKDLLTL